MLLWQDILSSRQIAVDIEEPLTNQHKVSVEESVVFTFPYQTNGSHATEPSIVGFVMSERHWKITFDFTETVNNYGLKRTTAY